MSVWNSIWAAAQTAVGATANPQGTLAAPTGTIAVDGCGNVYIKRGGGSTAFGWYLMDSRQFLSWMPTFVAGSGQMPVNRSNQPFVGGGTTLVNFLPTKSGVAGEFDPKRSYVGGYTSGVALNQIFWKLTSTTDYTPTQRIDTSVAANFQEFDWWVDLITTPRSSSVSGSTDLTTGTMRIWAGGAFGSTALQASGGAVSSDTLFTEWPNALTATNGLFGFAFRFSSAVDALEWKFVSANAPGGVPAQTVTPTGVAVAVNTAYRLRVRYVLVSGVLTAKVSINDGTEIDVTGNVGPGATPVPNQTQPFQPIVSLRTINGTTKSMCLMEMGMNYGTGVGLTC